MATPTGSKDPHDIHIEWGGKVLNAYEWIENMRALKMEEYTLDILADISVQTPDGLIQLMIPIITTCVRIVRVGKVLGIPFWTFVCRWRIVIDIENRKAIETKHL